jgi:hypothetical protein
MHCPDWLYPAAPHQESLDIKSIHRIPLLRNSKVEDKKKLQTIKLKLFKLRVLPLSTTEFLVLPKNHKNFHHQSKGVKLRGINKIYQSTSWLPASNLISPLLTSLENKGPLISSHSVQPIKYKRCQRSWPPLF